MSSDRWKALRAEQMDTPGLDHGAAVAAASQGTLYAFNSRAVVVGHANDELLGTRDLYAAYVHPDLIASSDMLEQLVQTLLESRRADRLLLRIPAGIPPVVGLSPLLRYVTKTPDHAEPRPLPPGWRLSRVDGSTRRFVLDSLSHALVQGYTAMGMAVSEDGVRPWVDRTYNRLGKPGGPSAFVALSRDEPVAHIAWQMVTDEVSGARYLEIIDMLTLAPYANLGLGRALVGAAERVAARRGVELLGNIVMDAGWSSVFARLVQGGWRHQYDIWLVTQPAPSSGDGDR